MSETTLDTIGQLLKRAADETDNPEVRYKINSARQLLRVVEHDEALFYEQVNDAVEDEIVLERLRELGYLE